MVKRRHLVFIQSNRSMLNLKLISFNQNKRIFYLCYYYRSMVFDKKATRVFQVPVGNENQQVVQQQYQQQVMVPVSQSVQGPMPVFYGVITPTQQNSTRYIWIHHIATNELAVVTMLCVLAELCPRVWVCVTFLPVHLFFSSFACVWSCSPSVGYLQPASSEQYQITQSPSPCNPQQLQQQYSGKTWFHQVVVMKTWNDQ